MKLFVVILAISLAGAVSAQTIVCAPDAPANMKLAAKEIRRYIYLRTGILPAIQEKGAYKSHGAYVNLLIDAALAPQEFHLKTDGNILAITGGSDIGVLYGAYRYAELLGVRFYLHGDTLPDERLQKLPEITEETSKPLFELRGINPWGYHPQGMDAWGTDDYKAVITQLAKMRMNFIGIHCYPSREAKADSTNSSAVADFSASTSEPTVWHGLSSDFDAQGQVRTSYPTLYYSALAKRYGNYVPKKTGDYSFGGALLFEDDAWSPPPQAGHCPAPTTVEGCNEVFNRTAAQFREAFMLARQLGVKTCLGTEAPLTIPKPVAQRTNDVRAVYEGTFRRIMASHPLDYYWLWTEENWTWRGNTPQQHRAVVDDILLADEARQNVNAPFQLATAGWVLGPVNDRAAFDRDLPKHIPLSAISRHIGNVEVDPAFARVTGRDTWAIPWLEGDGGNGLAGLQLWAGRMRRDAADALAYGCTGLMGLHWRTDILAPNAAALAQAAWDQSWNQAAAWTVPGRVANYAKAAISGTQDAPLYRTCRWDLGPIRASVPDGKYKVTLKFCEPAFKNAGERIFDVVVQGHPVLTHLDIFAKVGQFAALDYTFDDIAVTNGTLRVELIARKSLPCISAIAIESAGVTRKINIGGVAYRDWSADADKPRSLPADDFYADFARANFGLAEIGKVLAAMDGRVPNSTTGGCPVGKLLPDKTPWNTRAAQYGFVDDFAKFRPQVKGAGNLARFDYWLHTFRYYRGLAQLRCALARPDAAALTRLYADTYQSLLASVNSPGGLSMVVNMENCADWGPSIAKHAAKPWPKEYQGKPRLIVPCIRSVVNKGESLKLKIIALPATQPTVHIRPLGRGEWKEIPATHVARAVYEAKLPAAHDDFEYYITAGENPVWPPTAPQLNQTVVVTE